MTQTDLIERTEAVPAQQPSLPVIQDPNAAMLSLIERVVTDPSIDIDKLERIIQLQERMTAQSAERLFDEALSEAQSEMTAVVKDKSNNSTHSKYASFAALDRQMRPIYTKHGFSISFDTEASADPSSIVVVCRCAHRDGHRHSYRVEMPTDGKGAKGNDVMTKTHATGSAMTYGQRYLLKMIFNIAVSDDDDGNGSPGLREKSAGAVAAISTINEAKTTAELVAWKKNNGEVAKGLPEAAEIIALFNRRLEALKEKTAQ